MFLKKSRERRNIMIKKFFLFFMGIIFIVNPSSISAGDSKDVTLDKIIVTKRGYYLDPIYYPLAVPASEESTSSIVGADDIVAFHKETVIDAISNVPGVVIERKGRKYPATIMMRGEKNLTVLINGAYPGQDYRILNILPSTLVDEIEVIRDSSYLAYGSPNTSSACGTPSFGGVVNVKLKKPEREHGTELKAEYGSFNSDRESITNAGKYQNLNYS
jgi:outer membrane receptor protein involved in Fe transport